MSDFRVGNTLGECRHWDLERQVKEALAAIQDEEDGDLDQDLSLRARV